MNNWASEHSGNFLTMLDLTNYYTNTVLHTNRLWRLCDKGALYRIFKNSGSSDDCMQKYFNHVYSVIQQRHDLLHGPRRLLTVHGRFLTFFPSSTMYDGVSELASSSFFDSDDSPPPEFWLGVEGDSLVSFIPEDYISRANEGVECCMGGCLAWGKEI